MSDKGEREKEVIGLMGLMPNDGTREAYSLALEVKRFLESVKDEGTEIDSGGGLGQADLWVTVQGVEYYVTVKSPPPSTVVPGERK